MHSGKKWRSAFWLNAMHSGPNIFLLNLDYVAANSSPYGILFGCRMFKLFWYNAGGAGSEVWNRVYMIAPVKKFGRVRLSTIFLQNKYGGECRHGRTMSFCSVLSFAASKHQE